MDPRGDAADPAPSRLVGPLTDLAVAVDADLGATLYLADPDGVYEPVASSEGARAGKRRGRLFGTERSERPGARAMIAVPDARGGVVLLERLRAEPFSADDLAVARLLVRQLAEQIVVEGAGARATFWSRQLEAIQSVAAQLTRLTSVESVTAALCVETRRVIPYDHIRVHLLAHDGRTLDAVAFRSHDAAYAGETAEGLRITLGEGLTGAVAATGRPLLVADVARDPRGIDVPGTPQAIDESMLLVPMRHDSRVIGVITLLRLGLGMFSEDDLRLLGVLADQVAVAIENARLLAGRDRLVEELRALLEIGQASAMAGDEATHAGVLARQLRAAARADGSGVVRWDETGTRLVLLAADGVDATRRVQPDIEVLRYPAGRRLLIEGTRRFLTIHDLDLAPAERQMLDAWAASSVLLLPMTVAGRVVGVVELARAGSVAPPAPDELELMLTMANHAGSALENARLMAQLRQAADIDQVTGVNNHRYLQERLRQEVARAGRTGGPLAVLMIDLDGFKRINDEHGHADGDRVLRNVAAMLRLTVRANDVVARYGGDEFVILMPDTDEAAARLVADRVVRGIRGQAHGLSDGSEGRVACSVGMSLHPTDGRTAAALLKSADAAMYGVKRAGGSRVGRLRTREAVQGTPISVLG
ncbi:MAG: sensor domain-containing diguanylate cyclase [Chloroflexota bacterium]